MGNNRPPAEKKRRKKGRPSLLDLQKRTLKQQQQLQRNPSPSPIPIPYLRSPASGRRSTRRNPGPGNDDDDDDDGGNRREKKLKLVLRLPERSAGSPSGSDSEAEHQNRGIGGGNRDKAEGCNFSKGTDAVQGEPLDSGPTTPLPDKKLLLFILDRLQKKDTYGVFSEPVDPEELPDYHEVIEHPMDFGTVRKKLSSGVYANLEQFENDVFLISSNAMRYNASDTIYFRQARSIHELSKKNFENLRQESDDNEPEPKIAPRRGRPPTKNTIKRPVGRLPAERAAADFSDATLANAGDGNWSNLNHGLLRKGSASDKPGSIGVSSRASLGLRNSEKLDWTYEHKAEKHEEYSGSALKGILMRYGKKPIVIDENRRNTYKQPQLSICVHGPPILTTFDGEKQQLVPVGLHTEHAYARSLARFAANLGPIGWTIAAKKIERALPPGIKFGQGWVGDSQAPQQSQPPLLSTSNSEALQQSQLPLLSTSTAPRHSFSLPKVSSCNTASAGDKLPPGLEPPSNDSAVEEDFSKPLPRASASATLNRSSDSTEVTDPNRGSKFEAVSNLPSGDTGNSIQSKAPFQLQRNPSMQPSANGFSAPFGFSLASQLANMVSPPIPSGSFSMEIPMTHARALDMVSRGNSCIHQTPMDHSDVERAKLAGSLGTFSFNGPTKDPGHDSQGTWWGLSLQPKLDSILPDSNAQSQSPGSPVSGVVVDAQQPDDLALQL